MLCGLCLVVSQLPATAWEVEPGRTFEVKGKVEKGRDLSAAAALGGGWLLVASDETRGVQRARLDDAAGVLHMQSYMPLIEGEGSEIDLEGLAWDPARALCYAAGSHALSRKKNRHEDDRSRVLAAAFSAQGELRQGTVRSASLMPLLERDDVLRPHLEQPDERNGLDIEAVAYRDGRLYFGLRAPSLDEKAQVLEVEAAALFEGGGKLLRHELKVGAGRGIRDMAAIEAGFLLLVGASAADDQAVAREFAFWFWPGPGGAAEEVGKLTATGGKAEGLLVMEEAAGRLRVLVFHDGVKEGEPREYVIRRS